MYMPTHFEETRVPTMHDLIRAHPFGALVTSTPAGLDANHVPFEIDPEPAPYGTLRAHVARANPVWREAGNTSVLVIFQGPSTYISPAWYPTKQETGKVVPTWNYAVVHAHGTLRAIDDRAWLRAFVETLTNRHESRRPTPWLVSDAPADYIESMVGGIIGLEVPVEPSRRQVEGEPEPAGAGSGGGRRGPVARGRRGLRRDGRDGARPQRGPGRS